MNERTLYSNTANNLFDAIQLLNPDFQVDSLKELLDAFSDIDPNADANPMEVAARLAPIVGSIESLPPFPRMDGAMLEALRAVNPDLSNLKMISRSEVDQESKKRSRQIFTDWERLNNILNKYEDILRKRWIKKTKEQRKKLLLSAWPNMSTTHRPDFQAQHRETDEQRRTATRFRDAYLCPYINLEDLCKAKNLLLMFQSRGHNRPHVFAYRDSIMQIAINVRAVTVVHLDGFSMDLNGETPQTYGRLLSHKRGEASVSTMMAGLDFHPGRGLLVLELQEKILSFLNRCVDLILHDLIPLNRFQGSSTSPPPLLATPVPTDMGWPSVATMSAEAPYRVPVQFDFTRLQSLVNAKREEVEDHVWLLREDPGYFRNVVGDIIEHRHESLPYENGRSESLDIGRVFKMMLADAYTNLWVWDLASKQLKQLAALREHYAERISPRQKLPVDYEEAFIHFSGLMIQIRNFPLDRLKHGIFASPPLRNNFVRIKRGDPNDAYIRRKDENRKDYFIWLIEQLCAEENLLRLGPKNILDELERVIRNESEGAGTPQNDRLSAYASKILSDLAVAMEVDEQVANHQPNVGFLHRLSRDVLDDKSQRDTQPLFVVQDEIKALEPEMERAGYPLSKFHYPSDKPRTAQTTEKLRIAEQNLDKFWDIVDNHYTQQTGKTIHQLLSSALHHRKLERTPQWIDPAMPRRTTQPSTTSAAMNLDILDLEERTRVFEIDEDPAPKSKVKTRGFPLGIPIVDEPIPATLVCTTNIISVSKRAYTVLSVLFHNPYTEKQLPGEIPWTDFLHALSSTGFSIEKQTGSAWLFVPPSSIGSCPIIFHEPHPSSKIPIHIARRHGRRLTRTYGWNSDTFVIG